MTVMEKMKEVLLWGRRKSILDKRSNKEVVRNVGLRTQGREQTNVLKGKVKRRMAKPAPGITPTTTVYVTEIFSFVTIAMWGQIIIFFIVEICPVH